MVSMEEGGSDVPKRDLQRSRESTSKITSLKPISHAKIDAASMVFASISNAARGARNLLLIAAMTLPSESLTKIKMSKTIILEICLD